MSMISVNTLLEQVRDNKNENVYFHLEYLKNSGNMNANGDYSGGIAGFTYTNDTGNVMKVDCIILYLEDSGATFTGSNFAQLAGLTNGLKFYYNDGSKQQLHNDLPIKTNLDILQIFKDVKIDQIETGNLIAVWRPSIPILLKDTWKFGCDCNDNNTGIDNLNFQIEMSEIK